jgi:hypothetical protein
MAKPTWDHNFAVSVRTIITCSPQNTLSDSLAKGSPPFGSILWCFREIHRLSESIVRFLELVGVQGKKLGKDCDRTACYSRTDECF